MSTLKRLHLQARSRRQGKPAFTLLELIVVLLVLGVLAAIAVPTFNRVKENSVARTAQTTLEAIDRNGEAIAVSDPGISDAAVATAALAEVSAPAGMTITRNTSGDGKEVTVEYTRGGIVASGKVAFADGVGTITPAAVSAVTTPSSLTGLTVNPTAVSSTRLDLAWTAVTNTAIVGYNVYRLNPITGFYEFRSTSSTNSYADTGLTAGTSYSYKVAAYNDAAEGDLSSAVAGIPIGLPAAPTALSVSQGDLTLTLNFTTAATAAAPITSVKVYKDGVLASTLAASATSYTYTGLTNGTAYTFGVQTLNAVGESAIVTSSVSAVTTPSTLVGLTVNPTAVSSTRLDLAWTAVTNTAIVGYNVYRLNPITELYEIRSTASTNSYADTGLTAGTSYSYKVAAYNNATEGGLSSAVAGIPIGLPAAPTALSVSQGDLTLTLNFTTAATAAAPITSIKVYKDGVLASTLAASATSYTYTGLTNGTAYTFGVQTLNAVGESAIVTSSGSAVTTPSTLVGLTVNPTAVSSTRLDLAWTAVTNTAIVGYNVYRLNPVNSLYEIRSTASTNSYADTGLTAGTSYSYKVAAYNDATEGGLSSAVAGIPIGLPAAPTALSVSQGNLTLTLNFTTAATAAAPVTGVKVYRDGSLVTTLAASATSYTYTGLTNGTSYVLGVRATNAVGDSSLSTTTATPVAPTTTTVALSLSYASTAFSTSETSQTRAPSVSGGTASSFSYTGTLPTGVSFNTSTGVFTGPSAWNFQVAQISASDVHTCALTTSGGVKCWGSNAHGQLGNGTTTQRLTPVDVAGLTSGVASISAGNTHTCAVTTSGGAKCWGNNSYGRLGDGTTTRRTTPVDVSGLTSGVAQISAGFDHTCAVTTSGGAKCWGYNWNGRLGDGTTTDRSTPVDVSGLTSGVASISASAGSASAGGGEHTCAVTTSGGAKCWGRNNRGQLGDGTTTQSLTPVDVAGLTSGVASISAGALYTCARTTSGGAKCWGSNSYDELGDGTTTQSLTPVDVAGLTSGVASIAAGGRHTCAVTTSGGAKCWGTNPSGQLGDGTTTQRSTPVDVAGLTSGVASISAGGGEHTCAVTTSGGAKCWGRNSNGRLGDGTTTQRTAPVDVSGVGTNSGWPAAITVTVTATDSRTANTNVTLTNS